MNNRHNENVSPGKWALLIILHVVGCVHTKMFELGPIMFPYNIPKSDLRNIALILFVYLLVQYILVQSLIGGKKCGRCYHFRLVKLNLCISISSMLTLPLLPIDDKYIWIKIFIFVYEGIALISVLLSTAITILRTRESKRYSPSN